MNEILTVHNNHFRLHHSGAVYWIQTGIALIADVHLGKTTHFRKHGIAIPPEVIRSNYLRLQEVVDTYEPKELWFLGDLFHSYKNSEWDLFANWVKAQSATITLISGNHDVVTESAYEAIGIKVYDNLEQDTFYFTHYPDTKTGYFNFCGHIHPAVKLKGSAKQQIKLPCFVKNDDQLILPAFGDFTGNFYIDQSTAEGVYVCTDNEVFLV